MALSIQSPDEKIREIEDIINIQKANGSFHGRQVAFSLPAQEGACPPARSLESALPARPAARRKKRRARRASPPPEPVAWPSDSDITVLRMKGCALGAGRAGGLHGRPDGASMVNLATLVRGAGGGAASKQRAPDLLLPLSSWERGPPPPASARARLARFLRLYFCPCCTCLYEMEKSTRDSQDAASVYLTAARREPAR